jgi:peptide subunit release factor 1 (eRF1)
MSYGCSHCGGCDYDCKTPEYINAEGYPAVKCPVCETEIIIARMDNRKRISCRECGTVMEIVPALYN